MNCGTKDQLDEAIEFGNAINDTMQHQTAETTIKFLKTTTDLAEKTDTGYAAIGGKARIKESVTEKGNRERPYKGKKNDLLEEQALVGHFTHEAGQMIANEIITVTETKSTDAAIIYISKLTDYNESIFDALLSKYGKEVDEASKKNLLNGVKEMLLDIYKQQRTINRITKTDGKVKILLEQILLDPRRGLGGTADVIAIFSDNTAGIIDYKTKIIKDFNLDIHGNIVDPSKVIHPMALEKYKLQMGEYGRILRESYGVSSIKSIVILPIKLRAKVNSKTSKYHSKMSGLAFPGQDPLLEKVLPFSNKTGFKELDDYINSIDARIKKLEDKIKKDRSKQEELQPRIDQFERAKKELFLHHKLDSLIEFGKSLAGKVKKGELNKLTIAELQELLEELTLVENLAKATASYRKHLKEYSTSKTVEEFEKKINDINVEVTDAIITLKHVLFKDKIANLIETTTSFKLLDEFGNYIPSAQEGYLGKIFYQLSQYDNPVFKTLKKILNSINYKTRQKTDLVTEEIVETEAKLETWLSRAGKTHEDLIRILINPKTDNFWGKYSQEHIDQAKASSGAGMVNFYEPTERYHETYDTRFEEAKARFEVQGLEGDKLEKAIENWISNNDLALDKNGKPINPNAWENARIYHRLQIKDDPKAYNDQYAYILSVPELKAYYAMFEKYNKEFRNILGVDYNKLPNNFLPNVRKVMSERITEHGTSGLVAGTQDFFKDFSIREEERSEDSSYNSNEQIPIFFLNKFRNKDKSLQVGEKSYQFGRSLQIFAKMAYHYEASTEREAEILALQQFLSSEAEQLSQSRGKNLIDKMGNSMTEKLQASELPEIFKAYVDMYIYGVNVKSVIGDKTGRIEKGLLKAKEYFTLKVLGFNVIAGLGSLGAAKINTLIEANKGIIFNKTNYKESMTASWSDRERFLAMSAFFDPMNHRLNSPRLTGEKKVGERKYGDPTMKGWINKYVNSRMLMNTFSIGDQYIEELITVAMSKNYYVDEVGNVRKIKNDAQLKEMKGRLIYDLFSYDKEKGAKLNIPEEQMESVFMNFREAIQAGQSRIKGTIPEDDKAYWQNSIFGQMVMHFKSWMPGIMFERFGKVKFDDRIDSIYMGKYIALGKEFENPDKLAFSIFFKKILLPRMGKLVADLATFGLLSKSRLNDKVNKKQVFDQWLEENPHYKGRVTFEEFNEVQQKQLRSVIQELRTLLVFAGLIVLMGLDWDDDGEKDYKKYLLTRKLASLIFKVQQELAFVYSPVSFSAMIKSPLPTLGLVSDAWKTIDNSIDEILDIFFDEQRIIGGQQRDEKNIGAESIKWVPGVGGAIRFLDVMTKDVQYENTNF